MASKFSFDTASADANIDGSGDDNGGAIDPATLAGAGDGAGSGSGGDDYIRDSSGNIEYTPTGRPRKRRKSRTNSGNGSKAHNQDLGRNIDRLSAMLGFAHLAMSNGFKVPELKLDKVESDMLATSVVDVMAAFDIEISDKAMAVSGLISACGTIYAPRIVTYTLRKRKENDDNKPIIFPSKVSQFEKKADDELPPAAFNLGG